MLSSYLQGCAPGGTMPETCNVLQAGALASATCTSLLRLHCQAFALYLTCTALFPCAYHDSPGHAHVLQASALVGIIPDLNMDMYSLKRQEAGFEALLRAVAEVLLKHVDPDTVAHCARTLVHCTQHGPQAIQVPPPPPPHGAPFSLQVLLIHNLCCLPY